MSGINLGGFMFGNIDESGALEDEFLDEELRAALNSVGKKKDMIGLNLDLSVVGVAKEDVEDGSVSVSLSIEESISIDFSNINEAVPDYAPEPITSSKEPQAFEPQPSYAHRDFALSSSKSLSKKRNIAIKSIDNSSYKLTKDGRILRHTSFYDNTAIQSSGRFRSRKLKIKRKKNGIRAIGLFDNTKDLLTKPLPNIAIPKSSFLQAFLFLSLKKRINPPRSRNSVDENTAGKYEDFKITFSFLNDPNYLETSLAPSDHLNTFDLFDWESMISYDRPSAAPTPKINSTFLYAGIVPTQGRIGGLPPTISRPGTPSIVSGSSSNVPKLSAAPFSKTVTPQAPIGSKSLASRILNVDLLFGNWDEQICFDDSKFLDLYPAPVQLNMNDPYLIFESSDIPSYPDKILKADRALQKKLKKPKHIGLDGKPLVLSKYDKPISDRFNLSNDRAYEQMSKTDGSSSEPSAKNQARMMNSGRLGVHHSVPALKLTMPFYKTYWTKAELRCWHRPRIDLSPLFGFPLAISRLHTKKETSKRTTTVTSAKKLSLRNSTCEYSLVEYSEEFPLLVMNVGMATFLVHFYRKYHSKDIAPNNLQWGSRRTLESNEQSPFWHFGDVKLGESLPAIQNNLFRAPLAEHTPLTSDFLLIKSNIKGKQASLWYLRELPEQILLSGQVMPTMDVFSPNSRKHNQFCRNRIQAFAYRLFRKDSPQGAQLDPDNLPRLKIARIMAAFPQFSEASLRKWMKEYADSIRSSGDSGTWRLRTDAPMLNEDDLRALVTPEMICQYESMLAGQQKLSDNGLMDSAELEDDVEDQILENDSNESKCSPWNLSTNFISAASNKCVLQLVGSGDPSGRGEAFSFVKATQKGSGSLKLTTDSTALDENQDGSASKVNPDVLAYRKEISKIWETQLRVLSDSTIYQNENEEHQDFSIFDELPGKQTPHIDDETNSVNSYSSKNSSIRGIASASKTIQIKRIYRDELTGLEREEVEILEDPVLITAYLNQRRVWEKKWKRKMMAIAASATRSKRSRLDLSDAKPGRRSKKDVTVKCGTCGEIGHIRTNRVCPRFAEYEKEFTSDKNPSPPAEESRMDGPKITISRKAIESSSLSPNPAAATIKLKINLAASAPVADQAPAQIVAVPLPKPSGLILSKVKLAPTFSPLQQLLIKTIDYLIALPDSWPFRKPVSRQEYPHYYQAIEKPMDLTSIKTRINKKLYDDVAAFLSDLALLCENCLKFNGPDHPFSLTASNLYSRAEELVSSPQIPEERKSQDDDIIDV